MQKHREQLLVRSVSERVDYCSDKIKPAAVSDLCFISHASRGIGLVFLALLDLHQSVLFLSITGRISISALLSQTNIGCFDDAALMVTFLSLQYLRASHM